MLIKIGDFEFTSVWDGVFYKKLSRYPNISDWEKRTIIEFVDYENAYGFYEKLGMRKPNDVVVLNKAEWTDFTVE